MTNRDTKGRFIKGHVGSFICHSEESKHKISIARKNIVFTKEHRENLSKSHVGLPSWNKGKKLSMEIRRKLSAAHMGVKLSLERCLAMSRRMKLTGGPNWKGGITPINKRIRNSKEFKTWSIDVLKRDNFICQQCGKRGGYLNAHHIKSFSEYIESRFDIENGITLCRECHLLFHRNFKSKIFMIPTRVGLTLLNN